MFVDLLKAAQALRSASTAAGAIQPASTGEKSEGPRRQNTGPSTKCTSPTKCKPKRLRSLPYSWNEKEYKYKVVEFATLSGEVDELDEYMFVLRVRLVSIMTSALLPITDDVVP